MTQQKGKPASSTLVGKQIEGLCLHLFDPTSKYRLIMDKGHEKTLGLTAKASLLAGSISGQCLALEQYLHHANAVLLVNILISMVYSGAGGLLIGSVVGVLRSAHPVSFTITCGVQYFGLGAIYWGKT